MRSIHHTVHFYFLRRLLALSLSLPLIVWSADATLAGLLFQRKPGKSSTGPAKKEAPREIKTIPIDQQIMADSTYVEDLSEGIAHRWLTTVAKQEANIITIDL